MLAGMISGLRRSHWALGRPWSPETSATSLVSLAFCVWTGRCNRPPLALSTSTFTLHPDADGFLTLPDKPGLGIELNRDALKRFGVLTPGAS